jgi:hypothetical protein
MALSFHQKVLVKGPLVLDRFNKVEFDGKTEVPFITERKEQTISLWMIIHETSTHGRNVLFWGNSVSEPRPSIFVRNKDHKSGYEVEVKMGSDCVVEFRPPELDTWFHTTIVIHRHVVLIYLNGEMKKAFAHHTPFLPDRVLHLASNIGSKWAVGGIEIKNLIIADSIVNQSYINTHFCETPSQEGESKSSL